MPTVILDANLLVLLAVGMTSRSLIAKHRRLHGYSQEDFDLLVDYLSQATSIIISPHALVEASNLSRQTLNPARDRISIVLRGLVQGTEERSIENKAAVEFPEFVSLGLTDAVLLEISPQPEILLTVDLDLYLAAQRRGSNAINFNHMRVAAGLLP